MEFNLTKDDRALIIAILDDCARDLTDEQHMMLNRFLDILEHCGEAGYTMHIR